MTLETLQGIQAQLNAQLAAKLAEPAGEKPVMRHCNAIEIMGAIQLIGQLIQLEQQVVMAPPGATGPNV